MTKAILLALAAVVGSVLGILGFWVIDSHFHLPFAVGETGAWTDYGSLSFGCVGAVCGVVTGRVARGWREKPQAQVPVLSESMTASEEAAVGRSRTNTRPLTWHYRASRTQRNGRETRSSNNYLRSWGRK